MIPALLLVALASGEAQVTVRIPEVHVAGQAFPVRIEVEAPADGASLEGWQLTAAAFQLDGQPLAEHGDEPALALTAGQKKSLSLDLGPQLAAASGAFELAFLAQPAREVRVLQPAPGDLEFLDEAALPAAELTEYWVLLRTSRGDVLVEFWPDVAPRHVRNFLELSATGFYEGLTFHRVIPGFMIQGGDPDGNGNGGGPRRLKLEPSDRKHVRGVLSMARSNAPDSASSQFFVMHGDSPGLDGKYSAFGQVVLGMSAVDAIVATPRTPNDRPKEPQVMESVLVVLAPADAGAWRGEAVAR